MGDTSKGRKPDARGQGIIGLARTQARAQTQADADEVAAIHAVAQAQGIAPDLVKTMPDLCDTARQVKEYAQDRRADYRARYGTDKGFDYQAMADNYAEAAKYVSDKLARRRNQTKGQTCDMHAAYSEFTRALGYIVIAQKRAQETLAILDKASDSLTLDFDLSDNDMAEVRSIWQRTEHQLTQVNNRADLVRMAIDGLGTNNDTLLELLQKGDA